MNIKDRLERHIIFLRTAWAAENAVADDSSFDLLKDALLELKCLRSENEDLRYAAGNVIDWYNTGEPYVECLDKLESLLNEEQE